MSLLVGAEKKTERVNADQSISLQGAPEGKRSSETGSKKRLPVKTSEEDVQVKYIRRALLELDIASRRRWRGRGVNETTKKEKEKRMVSENGLCTNTSNVAAIKEKNRKVETKQV
jgi:hypothetical protein